MDMPPTNSVHAHPRYDLRDKMYFYLMYYLPITLAIRHTAMFSSFGI